MTDSQKKTLAKKAGVSVKKVEDYTKTAEKEAQDMGFSPSKNQNRYQSYVYGIVENMLGLTESKLSEKCGTKKKKKKYASMSEAFQDSEYDRWDDFVANFDEATLVSSDFMDLPESPIKPVGREEEEGAEYDNVRTPVWDQEGYNMGNHEMLQR